MAGSIQDTTVCELTESYVDARYALMGVQIKTPELPITMSLIAIKDASTTPTYATAQDLPALRAVTFTDRNVHILEFGLDEDAQFKTTTNMDGDTIRDPSLRVTATLDAFLNPSTAYKVIAYIDGEAHQMGSFTTIATTPMAVTQRKALSPLNFTTKTNGDYQVPIVMAGVSASMSGFLVAAYVTTDASETSGSVNGIASVGSDSGSVVSEYSSIAEIVGTNRDSGLFIYQILNLPSVRILRATYTSNTGTSSAIHIFDLP